MVGDYGDTGVDCVKRSGQILQVGRKYVLQRVCEQMHSKCQDVRNFEDRVTERLKHSPECSMRTKTFGRQW
jgi:hypothetical protein